MHRVKLKVIFSDQALLAAHRDTITAQTYYMEKNLCNRFNERKKAPERV